MDSVTDGRNEQEALQFMGNTRKVSCTKRIYTVVNVVFSLLSIIISITALVLWELKLPPSRSRSDVKQVNSSQFLACVPCQRLNLTKSPEQLQLLDQIHRLEKGTRCCAGDQEQLNVLFKLVMLRTLKPTEPLPPVVNPGNFSMSGASMHKKLVASTTENSGNYPYFHPGNEAHPLYFAKDETTPLLEHIKNVELMTTTTRIREPGLYLVYCSVAFKPDSAIPCHTFAQKTWSVNITRVRPNDNTLSGVLLTAKHTCCDDCVRNHETGYTAGVFMLKENDELLVDVTGEGLVSYKPQSTFFGLAMLSSAKT